jgi:predicted GNAT superfamily acetyltransferase
MGQVEIRISTVAEMLRDAELLFQDHYDEVAKNKEVMKLKPDVKVYTALEKQDKLLILAAYIDNKMVGYSVNILSYHLHYADLFYAHNDILFVVEEYRNSKVGLALIKKTEAFAKALDAKLLLWHAKEDTALDKLMPRLGYGVQDIIHSKEL